MSTTSSELVSSVVGPGGVWDLGRGGLILGGECGCGAIGMGVAVGRGARGVGVMDWGGGHGDSMGGGTTKSCWMSINAEAWRASGVRAATVWRAWFHKSNGVVVEDDADVVGSGVELDEVRHGAVLVAAWAETVGSVIAPMSRKGSWSLGLRGLGA